MRGGGGHYAGATVQVAESSWGMATMHTQFGWGPGAGCEAPAVQLGMVRAGYPMVGRSFGHDLAGACTVRRSLYSTQEFVPNDLGLCSGLCSVGGAH